MALGTVYCEKFPSGDFFLHGIKKTLYPVTKHCAGLLYKRKTSFISTKRRENMTNQDVEKYVRMFHTMLYRLAFSYLRSAADAEDVCQESFIRLMKYQGQFPTDEDCKRWLIRVSINLSKNLLKYRKSHAEPMDFPYSIADETAVQTPQNELVQVIKQMPPEYSAVIHLFYYEGYTAKEVAQILGISVTAVTSRLSRGRRRLKILLTEEEQI